MVINSDNQVSEMIKVEKSEQAIFITFLTSHFDSFAVRRPIVLYFLDSKTGSTLAPSVSFLFPSVFYLSAFVSVPPTFS